MSDGPYSMKTPAAIHLDAALVELRSTLPPGSVFEWSLERDGFVLDRLHLPLSERGIGTGFLAKVLHAADCLGVPTRIWVDPTLEPGDPDLYSLARWYSRFDYEWTGVNAEYWLELRRTAHPVRNATEDGFQTVLFDYGLAKAAGFMTRDEFDARLEAMVAALAAEPST